MGQNRYCITLVHGTFASGAAWTLQGSALCRALKAGLGDVRFKPFKWNGKNDDGSRTSAATELAEQVGESLDADPQALHAIIAHSHGGNIILRAAAHPRVANRLSSLVCISTPFFVPARRDIVAAVWTLAQGFAWFFAIASLMFVLAYQFTNFSKLNKLGMPRNAGDFRWWVIATVIALIVALTLQVSRRRMLAWVSRRQEHRIGEITLPKLGRSSILCIWAKGDEVMLGFRALDRLADLSLFWLRPLTVVAAFVLIFAWLTPAGNNAIFKIRETFGFSVFAMVLIPILPFALLSEYAANLLGFNISFLLPIATAILAVMTIALLTLGTWVTAAFLHVILKLIPFGMNGWRFIDTFFLRISPSNLPPDRSNVLAEEMTLPRNGLIHSSVYGNDAALQRIVAFIRAKPGPPQQA